MAAATAIVAEMQAIASKPAQWERIETLTVAEFLQGERAEMSRAKTGSRTRENGKPNSGKREAELGKTASCFFAAHVVRFRGQRGGC